MSNMNRTGLLTSQSQLQGRYTIIATVGKGGMSAVYKAIDRQNNNHLVAIKEMSLSHYHSPAKRREARGTLSPGSRDTQPPFTSQFAVCP